MTYADWVDGKASYCVACQARGFYCQARNVETCPLGIRMVSPLDRLAARAGWPDDEEVDDRQAERLRQLEMAIFEFEVDPDGVLPPTERERRAVSARNAHIGRAALAANRLGGGS